MVSLKLPSETLILKLDRDNTLTMMTVNITVSMLTALCP